jgi:phage terminase large subunit-like protein
MPEKKIDLAEALRSLSEGLSARAKNPGMAGYKPTDKQEIFHRSDNYIRLYIGGNRAGKTHGGVMEDLWWATNTHPYIETPEPPVYIRVVVVDFPRGFNDIMFPKFKELTNKEDLKGGSWDKAWSETLRVLSFENGSQIQFMSYEQELDKFAGASKHLIHFDEEPPKHIYNECAARVIDTKGKIFLTMTPVNGMTWVYEDIYEPTKEANDSEVLIEKTQDIGEVFSSKSRDTTVIEVGSNENPHLSSDALVRYFSTLDEEERIARSKGTFVAAGGKVFKDFSRSSHVIPIVDNPGDFFRYCNIYTSTDHGWNNPTAWLWHAVFPDGRVVTFHEHYAREMTIKEHSDVVKAFEKQYDLNIEIRTGDPAMGQHSAITGTSILQEYAANGLYIYTDSVPKDPGIGIAKMTQYFRPIEGVPAWTITENCVNFIRELTNLQWQKFESRKVEFRRNRQENVQKKDDHAFDSAKYFATFLPDLKPDMPKPELPKPGQYTGYQRYDEALVRAHENALNKDEIQWTTLETWS